MAKTRRTNESPIEEIIEDLFKVLRDSPWWVGPIVIALGWGFFRFLLPWVLCTIGPEGFGKALADAVRQFAWLAPIFFTLLWLVALLNKQRDGRLLAAQRSLEDVRSLGWREFEQLLAEAYRQRGYEVTQTVGGADGGVDLVLLGREAGHRMKLYVQCKHYKARQVGVAKVRELCGVVEMSGGQAAGLRGVLVTSGTFTGEALREAEQAGIELVDAQTLMPMLADVQKGVRQPQQARPRAVPSHAPPAPPSAVPVVPNHGATVPSCPRCGAVMARRTARKGASAGSEFWGCTRYPTCRGTRSVE